MAHESSAPPHSSVTQSPNAGSRILRRRKHRDPLLVFLAKGLLATGVLVGTAAAILSVFQLHYDPQRNSSLPYHAWVVVTFDDSFAHGDYVAFHTDERMSEFFPIGTSFIKEVVGMPGDRVVVTGGEVIVNGDTVGELPLAKTIGKPESAFSRDLTVPQGHYWVMGTKPISYDSRYWGTISKDQVIGQGHPIF
ncbi:signal peptidase I [Modicisalibacter sp. MOD 31.J]|uniref:signal peptidase I n=1 Tax=Modicisalibacter sp. MOD 31.J TaxID=2831897 RepID=UPI001CCD41FB|nr:signal peptidase I [Modicisalibacter sp. MOD 31.J]MBZ9574502.1 signal peptidase I [Modicisalibacter sp. MOD 31.J]